MAAEVEELERLVAQVRVARDSVEAQRAAVGRYALVWWEGEAADRYRALVDERRAALARVADELSWLEDAALALASAARADAGPLRVVGRAS